MQLKQLYIPIITFIALLAFPLKSYAAEKAMYEHTSNEYSFNVGQFTALKVMDNVNVVYHCNPDSTARVFYHAEPDFADAFIFTNSGGTLKIQVTTEDVDKPGLPTIYVYSDYLSKVDNYSDYNVLVENPTPCPDFQAVVVGNGSISVNGLKATTVNARITAGMGSITLGGTCTDAKFRMTGTGTIQADRLKTENAICKILGSGSIGVNASKTLQVKGLGSTKIYYKGNPAIKHSGGGKLIKMD